MGLKMKQKAEVFKTSSPSGASWLSRKDSDIVVSFLGVHAIFSHADLRWINLYWVTHDNRRRSILR